MGARNSGGCPPPSSAALLLEGCCTCLPMQIPPPPPLSLWKRGCCCLVMHQSASMPAAAALAMWQTAILLGLGLDCSLPFRPTCLRPWIFDRATQRDERRPYNSDDAGGRFAPVPSPPAATQRSCHLLSIQCGRDGAPGSEELAARRHCPSSAGPEASRDAGAPAAARQHPAQPAAGAGGGRLRGARFTHRCSGGRRRRTSRCIRPAPKAGTVGRGGAVGQLCAIGAASV